MKTMKELLFPSKNGILKIGTYGLIKIEVNGNTIHANANGLFDVNGRKISTKKAKELIGILTK